MTEMGLRLGESRNVVAGRIDRARKSSDPRFQPRPHVRKLKPAGETVGSRDAFLIVSQPKPKLLVDLGPGECHFPVSNPALGEKHLFCAAPVERSGKDRRGYCAEHEHLSVSRPSVSPSPRAAIPPVRSS
jgi:hypothetical protein